MYTYVQPAMTMTITINITVTAVITIAQTITATIVVAITNTITITIPVLLLFWRISPHLLLPLRTYCFFSPPSPLLSSPLFSPLPCVHYTI